LTYGHDLLGRRTSVAGSWARTTLPSPVTAAYDAANQVSRFGTAPVSYDAAGQLTTDGTHIYEWDGRHQLASIDGGATGSFVYDGFGRRTQTTLGGTTTAYLYAGANAVQEQTSSGTPTANLLTGGVDEIFTRTDTAGTLHPLGDVQGSTIATSDGSGAIGTTYTYGAFGQTSPSGAGGLRAQYTGRENDGTGLYYYRARYYAPALQRFISEDPLEFGGGDVNLYAYVGNDPANLTDPSGENPLLLACAGGAAFDALVGIGMDWYSGRKDAWSFSRIGGNAVTGCGAGLVGFGIGKAAGWAVREAMQSRWLARFIADEAGTLNLGVKAESSANLAKGSTLPQSLRQQLAIEQAAGDLSSGTRLPLKLGDARWHADQGWVKMEQVIESGGEPIRVHYVQNTITGATADFKIIVRH